MTATTAKSRTKANYVLAQLTHWLGMIALQPALLFAIYLASDAGRHTFMVLGMSFIYLVQAYALVEHWRNQSRVSYVVLLVSAVALAAWAAFTVSVSMIAVAALIAVLLILGYLTQRFIQNHPQNRGFQQASRSSANKSNAIQFFADRSSSKLRDILGMSETKDRLYTAVAEIVNGKNAAKARNGLLFTGEPGNGKTVFAAALAGEFNLPIISVTIGDLASQWINKTTENVKKLFDDARAQAPCVLFLDEVDSLIGDRGNDNSSNKENANVVNTILAESVKIRGSGVVLIAATNFVDRLDPAAIREGRFDFKVEIPAPDLEARTGLIQMSFSKAGIKIDTDVVASAAKRWEGFSSKRLLAICEEVIAGKKGTGGFELKDLMDALRRIQGRKGRVPEATKELKDLILSADLRKQARGLVTRMINIEEIEANGGSVPKGVVMGGPPGTGKSSFAATLAKESGWAFLPTTGSDLMKPDAIDKLITTAKDLRPAIVFIDEADDLFKDRTVSAVATFTNKMLTAMDGALGKIPDVLFMAASNHPEEFDPAAFRPGRFTEKMMFTLPEAADMIQYVEKWIAKTKAKFAVELSASAIVENVGECSIPEMDAILQEAVNHMLISAADVGEVKREVNTSDIGAAYKIVMAR